MPIINGTSGNDILGGTAGVDEIYGFAGDDLLNGFGGADILVGGLGNDLYFPDQAGEQIIENENEGIDRVDAGFSYTLGEHVENLTLSAGSIDGTGNSLANVIWGTSAQNRLAGRAGNDQMYGAGGNDTLDGGDGDDLLDGGEGQDTLSYQTASAGITVNLGLVGPQDTFGAGIDQLVGFENLVGSAHADTLIASSLTFTIRAGFGDDTLIAHASGDLLFGEEGSDRYVSGAGNDILRDDGYDGNDTADYSLANGSVNVTLLTIDGQNTGAGGVDTLIGIDSLTGSNFNDVLIGHSGNGLIDNRLTGLGGNDHLIGHGGNDILDGGSGADLMEGGISDDIYLIDNVGDQAVELAGEGTDEVQSSISWAIGASLENLTLTGGSATTGTGNELANRIVGNSAANVLTGGLGADILTGGAGADNFRDTCAGLSGDTITDFAAGDTIILTDASLSGFSASLTGNTLTYTGGSLTLQGNFAGYQIVAGAASGGGVQLTIQAAVAIPDVGNDFNGDGRSDILWRNVDGQMSNWLGQANGGFTPNNANAAAVVPIDWQIAATGDFNGDGRDDILWRNVDGQISNWLATAAGGFTPNNANAAAVVPTDWHVLGTGDFNGDGRDDILWRHNDGTISNWLGTAAGGYTPNDTNAAAPVPTAWHVAGVADFNGDGRDDILWRHNDGTISNWLGTAAGGYTPNDANAAVAVPLAWSVVAIGDYNGDGRDDILWRHTDGTLSNWLGTAAGGYTPNDSNAATPVPVSWEVQPEPFWL